MYQRSLFTPLQIGPVEVPNRVALAPMGNHLQGPSGEMTDAMIAYLEARARGGTGLIITPFASVSPNHPTLGAYSDELLDGLRQLADRIHAYDTKVFLQINDLGAINPYNRVASTERSSPLYVGGVVPRRLARNEIPRMIERYVATAERARSAGFDGIEFHGGYSYMVASFYSPHLNLRTDDYGGSFEKRMRFVDQIIDGIQLRSGTDFPIGFKLNAHEHVAGGIDIADAIRIAKHLEARGIAYLHVVSSFPFDGLEVCEYSGLPTMYEETYAMVQLAERLKQEVGTPVMATGGIVDPEIAEAIIAEGRADMVAIGRGLIADPDWVEHVRNGKRPRYCIRCNTCHLREVFNGEPIRCTVNPTAGREMEFADTEPAAGSKRVAVLGGGPAGMQAAVAAAARGHQVALYEARSELGGKVGLAAQLPFKLPVRSFVENLAAEIQADSRITVNLNTRLEPDDLKSLDTDIVVCAIGARPIIPDIPGLSEAIKSGRAVTAVQVLEDIQSNGPTLRAETYLVLGAGLAGCEVGWYLATRGRRVSVSEMMPEIDALDDEHPLNRAVILRNLRELGVATRFNRQLVGLSEQTATFRTEAGFEETVEFEKLVLATGYAASTAFCEAARESSPAAVHVIGDCGGELGCFNAMHEGHDIAMAL